MFLYTSRTFQNVSSRAFFADDFSKDDCLLEADDSGLTLDAVCFVFLLLQLRIYKSHYFTHVVLELEVQNKLAARGAELINTNLIKRVEHERANEEAVLETIRQKMARIRKKQSKIENYEELNHYDSACAFFSIYSPLLRLTFTFSVSIDSHSLRRLLHVRARQRGRRGVAGRSRETRRERSGA